jgi:hypothetical protein
VKLTPPDPQVGESVKLASLDPWEGEKVGPAPHGLQGEEAVESTLGRDVLMSMLWA